MDPNRRAEKAAKLAAQAEKYKQDTDGLTFVEWPKISRLNRDIVITEKLDGTNAAIGITAEGRVYAQSRSRIVTPDNDNYGFAAWVERNADLLREHLGAGLHFGEWWGVSIARGYGLSERRFSLFNVAKWGSGEGALALTNLRLSGVAIYTVPVLYSGPWTGLFGYKVNDETRPDHGQWMDLAAQADSENWLSAQSALRRMIQVNPRPRFAPSFILEWLARVGSQAVPGFMKPEGIVVFHRAGGVLFKATIERDEEWKGKSSGEPDSGS